MKPNARFLLLVSATVASASVAQAQIEVVATETFEYAVPGLVHDGAGGTGWSNSWFVTGGANDGIVMFDNTIAPTFALSDGIGGHAGQAAAFEQGYRRFDTSLHPDITNGNGKYGADGSTIWISFSTVNYQGQPFEHYGGLSLFNVGVGEEIFLGSPWNTNEWGIDDEGGGGAPPMTVAGSDDTVAARLVYRIDFAAGGERLRMWVDPPVDYPNFAADLDTPIADLEFDEISIASGGNNGDHYFWDAIEFAKGKPVVGGVFQSGFCPVADNSTGGPAGIIGFGSAVAADNDLTLHVLGLPSDAFGVLLAARTTAIVPNPGGSLGTLCLGSDFGRGVGGVIWNSGSAGAATVVADLTAMPTSTGAVAVASGEQWILQAWYRDSVGGQAVSNLSELWGHTFQ